MGAPNHVPEEAIRRQYEYMDLIAARNAEKAQLLGCKPRAVAHTFGCQQNFADTERLAGMLSEMGYELTEDVNDAALILYNTCDCARACGVARAWQRRRADPCQKGAPGNGDCVMRLHGAAGTGCGKGQKKLSAR